MQARRIRLKSDGVCALAREGAAAILAVAVVVGVPSCREDDFSNRPPKIYFASDGSFELAPGDTLTLRPQIVYDNGCAYAWTDAEGNLLSTERDLVFTSGVMRDYSLTFTAGNGVGADTFGISVSVQLRAAFDEMDNFSTKRSSVLALHPDTLLGAFRWRGVEFANATNADTSMWYGFAFSNRAATTSTTSSAVVGTAYVTGSSASSNAYLAVHASGGGARVLFPRDYTPMSVDIANDNFVYLASKFGYTASDAVAVEPAARGDYFRVVVEGLGPDGMPNGAAVSYSLIDCDFDNPAKYVRAATWTRLDLRGLGSVRGLLLSVETSTGFPALFCIDNLRLQD